MILFLISGLQTNTLTLTKDFFLEYSTITQWRLEVIYSSETNTSNKILDIQLNDSPRAGNCSIDPLNGTILTLFTINCSNWLDSDGIKGYTIFGLFVFSFSFFKSDHLDSSRSTC